MNTNRIPTAASAWTAIAMRRVGIDTRSGKYCCQIITPVTISTRISPVIAQNTIFWPALYLPISGRFSSCPFITSPRCAIQVPSPACGRFSRHICTNSSRKLKNSSTPTKGCSQRVVWPPPNSPVRK